MKEAILSDKVELITEWDKGSTDIVLSLKYEDEKIKMDLRYYF